MKKTFFVILFLLCALCAFAQEKKMATGLGLEWNMNSRHNFAGGTILSFDYNLPGYFAAVGFTVGGSSNFSGFEVLEPAVLLRYYILNDGYSGFFTQLDAGTFIIFEDGEDTEYRPLLGIRGGYRLLLDSPFYIEPFGRLGIPFAFGVGAVAGIRF